MSHKFNNILASALCFFLFFFGLFFSFSHKLTLASSCWIFPKLLHSYLKVNKFKTKLTIFFWKLSLHRVFCCSADGIINLRSYAYFPFGSQVKNPGKKHHVKFHKVYQGSISTVKTWAIKIWQRDGMGREEGGGFRMGNTCITVADSFWYLAKLIQLCKV